MVSILTYSNNQKKTAERILGELDLLNQLKPFGKVTFSGSFFNNTMIKPDIDLIIYVKNDKEVQETISFLKKFFKKNSNFYEVWVENRKFLFGKSIHARYKDKLKWKLDILIVTKPNKSGLKLSAKIKRSALKKEIRKNILTLKYYFHKKGLGFNGLSMHIYGAVINRKIKNLRDFKKYLKLKGIKK